MLVPKDLKVERVSAPGNFQYAVTRDGEKRILAVYFGSGQQGLVPVMVQGKLGREGKLQEFVLPRLEMLDVARQSGDVAVQVDPGVDVDAVDLKNCERVLLGQYAGWLNPEQQRVTRLGLHYGNADYAATLRLSPRKPDVVCDTISNVRVTDRAIEETILLDFTIRNAGVRSLSFLLPASMADSRISVPMLRQKTIEPIAKTEGSPVRVRIELQDDVMDQLRVLIENDRLLTAETHDAPIPTVEIGRTNRRYATIESAGRDSVKVVEEKKQEMESLGRQQKEWASLKEILGRDMTLAYLVASDAQKPRLPFCTERHVAVETVGAGIGLAETTLVLDANGAYRAQQVLRVDNSTEQFLEIHLPENARLWTARVAGEPVKPTTLAENAGVRIPLLKTAPGELHYDVVLKYGGKMPTVSAGERVKFPLIECRNIRPELSQVRLYLPDELTWFDFGGTMRQATGEAELQAGFLKFQTKQTEQIVATLRQGDRWAKLRAAANLQSLTSMMDGYSSNLSSSSVANQTLKSEVKSYNDISNVAKQESQRLNKEPAPVEEEFSNRQALGRRFEGQQQMRARNVVNDMGENWKADKETAKTTPKKSNDEWLRRDKRSESEAADSIFDRMTEGAKATEVSKNLPPNASDAEPSLGGSYRTAKTNESKKSSLNAAPQQPTATQIVTKGVVLFGESSVSSPQTMQAPNGSGQRGPAKINSEERYKERLQQQANVQTPAFGNSGPQQASQTLPTPYYMSDDVEYSGGRDAKDNSFAVAKEQLQLPPTAAPQKPAEAKPAANAPVVPPPASGMASLDFELPTRGTLYCFTVPRGEAEVTGRAVSSHLLRRLGALVAVAVVAICAGIMIRRARRWTFAWLRESSVTTLLICVGLLMLLTGFLPILGFVAIVVGCVLKTLPKRSENV
jgi:hypothetical protein